uniref:SH3 domain-containing protein n=1 Tax=Parastrongyloides trichosuri TaxID=131310 RepID=A0A0N4ZK72_PARTI
MQMLLKNDSILKDMDNQGTLELEIDDNDIENLDDDNLQISDSIAVIGCAKKLYNAMMKKREKVNFDRFLNNTSDMYKEVIDVEKCIIKVQAKVREKIARKEVERMRTLEDKMLGLNINSEEESKEKEEEFLNFFNTRSDVVVDEIKLHEDLIETLNLLRDVHYGIHTIPVIKAKDIDLTTIMTTCHLQSERGQEEMATMKNLYQNSKSTPSSCLNASFQIKFPQWSEEECGRSIENETIARNDKYSIPYSGNSLLSRRKSKAFTFSNTPPENCSDTCIPPPTLRSTSSLPPSTPTDNMSISATARFKKRMGEPKHVRGRWNCHDYYYNTEQLPSGGIPKNKDIVRLRTNTISSNRDYQPSKINIKNHEFINNYTKGEDLLGTSPSNSSSAYISIPSTHSQKYSASVSPCMSHISLSSYDKTVNSYSMDMSDESDDENSTPLSDSFSYSPPTTRSRYTKHKTVYSSTRRNNVITPIIKTDNQGNETYSECISGITNYSSHSPSIMTPGDLSNQFKFEKALKNTPMSEKSFKMLVNNNNNNNNGNSSDTLTNEESFDRNCNPKSPSIVKDKKKYIENNRPSRRYVFP